MPIAAKFAIWLSRKAWAPGFDMSTPTLPGPQLQSFSHSAKSRIRCEVPFTVKSRVTAARGTPRM